MKKKRKYTKGRRSGVSLIKKILKIIAIVCIFMLIGLSVSEYISVDLRALKSTRTWDMVDERCIGGEFNC